MSPVQYAISTVNRALGGAIGSFHPASVPLMSRLQYRRELVAWMFLPAMLGVVEGGVVGVLAKFAFDGVVATRTLVAAERRATVSHPAVASLLAALAA